MSQENVIEVKFNQHNDIAKELESYLDLDDPLEDLLNEFEDAEPEADPEIFNRREADSKLSYKDTPLHMTDVLIQQMGHIREDLKRLNYYLDEINIDN